ncbi:alpha-glucuronidase [Micromonospora sp. DT233]|uniref:alpha-glucuronidase n=1 Tax=Micromonospora sp. DT233 TaxID=3393432 RepID=UPI003CEF4E8B
MSDGNAAWLHPEAFRPLGSRRVLVHGAGVLVDTVFDEVARACAAYGGRARRSGEAAAGPTDLAPASASAGAVNADTGPVDAAPSPAGQVDAGTVPTDADADAGPADAGSDTGVDLVLALRDAAWPGAVDGAAPGDEGFLLTRRDDVPVVLADAPAGLLYGLFHLVRLGESAFDATRPPQRHRPATALRMLDHWDNVDVHPVMGQVERGYAGGSIFWRDGAARGDRARLRHYARLLAASGVNAISVNNVNVHATEARLLTGRLGEVAEIADVLRPYGIRVHLSVTFAAPIVLGGLPTADPCDEAVRRWWAATTRRVYARIPDFGGYLVKADSEGQPGPFSYGRSHADGANVLADALAPHGGLVHWRAFVYNHHQDWRDRSTDRARAAHDHFAPLDGLFRDNVILQVKHGPVDFQPREPVSPVLAAMPATRMAVEFQVTQEYTGQQRHVCYLGPAWREVLRFAPWGPGGPSIADVAAGRRGPAGPAEDEPGRDGPGAAGPGAAGPGTDGAGAVGGGLVAVANVGDDPFWTGHPLAQANLYAFGRLAWDPERDPLAVLDEWIGLTFPASATGDPALVRETLHAVMDDSWRCYERYTAPLGVGFMVQPGDHYGPDVDGYEYSRWGTYHFADRDGVGVDRSRATGTGFTSQYPPPWSAVYESAESCPDELLLFFHHVPYDHVLHSGSTVIQHIYDTHFAGVEQVLAMRQRWRALDGVIDAAVYERVAERLDEQVRSAIEWRDQINTYFFRKSGVPDRRHRRIY